MSKAIRVIDLLNKIANGEEVPKQIEYKANLYRLDEDKNYRDVVDGSYFVGDLTLDLVNLNDEAEIIEEQEEIDIQKLDENIKYYNIIGYSENEKMLFNMIQDTANRINKLVQAVKQLDKKDKGEKIIWKKTQKED